MKETKDQQNIVQLHLTGGFLYKRAAIIMPATDIVSAWMKK